MKPSESKAWTHTVADPSSQILDEPAVSCATRMLTALPPSLAESPDSERVEVTADARNPQGGEFPGSRGPNNLIIYDPAYGPRTTTNPWGAEAMVTQGIVVHVGGNDSPIPCDGWVLSGHGEGKDWILKHIQPGDEVGVQGTQITRTRAARSRLWRAVWLLEHGRHALQGLSGDQAKAHQGNLAAAEAAARSAALLVAAHSPEAPAQVQDALRKAEKAFYGAHRSRTPEARGVWVRLHPSGPAAPDRLVNAVAAANGNLILPETVYYGRTIYPPVPDSPLGQWEEFQGSDPLATLIDASHRRGIQVHAWCHIFFVGFSDSPLVARYPDWLAKDRHGRTTSIHEVGYSFFQPTCPEARALLLRTLEDLVRRYPLDGLQLDYIRYPNVPDDADGYDYSDAARRQFRAASGHDPADLSPQTDPTAWRAWQRFRQEAVTGFVREAHDRLKAIRPTLQLSAAVFPDREDALGHKMQDWKSWVDAGYLDFLSPMAYFTDDAPVGKATRDLRQVLGPAFPIYTGVGPYLGLTPIMVVDQVEAVRGGGGDGVIFFSHNDMNEQQYGALGAGVFQEPAAWPARN